MITRININGVNVVGGRNINISGGRVILDGNDVTPDAKDIKIEVHGNVNSIEADACNTISVDGSVDHISTQSGDVKCGDIKGSVQTMSGDVRCGNVGGSVKTMSGDINHR